MNHDDYYRFFDERSNQGVLFNLDLSKIDSLPVDSLTPAEINERQQWQARLPEVENHYESSAEAPRVTTSDMLLQQRIMTPNLGVQFTSSRSKLNESRRGRRYPTTITSWVSFRTEVEAFNPTHQELNRRCDVFDTASRYSNSGMPLTDELQEETFLVNILKYALVRNGIMGKITKVGGIGKPDALILKQSTDGDNNDIAYIPSPADVAVIVEFKSTHNLPLPMSAEEIVHDYNNSYQKVYTEDSGRTPLWSRVCHPIGQLLGYMVENGRRYGALSSATRSYFVKIEGDGSNARVFISDAIFVGQHNFLRAWTYLNSLGCGSDEPLVPSQITWNVTSKEKPTPPAKGRTPGLRSGGTIDEESEEVEMTPDNGPQMNTASIENDVLPKIPFDEIKIIEPIGCGHNGVVHLATWRTQRVALKQFDVGKDGYEWFDSEISAYLKLKDAWGELVPTPLFLSESWSGGIKFLGLQLGRVPKAGVDDVSAWGDILNALETQYGFRHEDADRGGNMVLISDGGKAKERLVAIDLEGHTMMHQTS